VSSFSVRGVRFGEWKDVPTPLNPVTLSNQLNIEHITWSSRSDSTANAPVEPVEYWTLPHDYIYAVLVEPMTHFLYVRRVGQDHQSILDDLSGWPVRTPVKYLLYVCHIGQDHQSILDDLSGWPVRTPTNKYTEWIFSRYQANPPVHRLNIRSVLG
jgi:hypothetical protein